MKGHIHMGPEETAKLKTLRWHASTRGTNKAEDDILCNMTEPINGCGALKKWTSTYGGIKMHTHRGMTQEAHCCSVRSNWDWSKYSQNLPSFVFTLYEHMVA